MANKFVLNETSYHGAGAVQEIATEVKARGFHKALVCSDPDLVRFGVTAKVLSVLDANALDYALYTDIKPKPTIENVQSGVAAYKAACADYIIAVGGGSSMDTAKAIGSSLQTRLLPMYAVWRVLHRRRSPAHRLLLCQPLRELQQRLRLTM